MVNYVVGATSTLYDTEAEVENELQPHSSGKTIYLIINEAQREHMLRSAVNACLSTKDQDTQSGVTMASVTMLLTSPSSF